MMKELDKTISWDQTYKSPARKLISVLKKGRDHWKLRYKENSKNTEALRKKVYDLKSSRDNWKSKALSLEKELEDIVERTGVPRAIVADKGPDLQCGLSMFNVILSVPGTGVIQAKKVNSINLHRNQNHTIIDVILLQWNRQVIEFKI